MLSHDNLLHYVLPINKRRENNKSSLIEIIQENKHTEGVRTATQLNNMFYWKPALFHWLWMQWVRQTSQEKVLFFSEQKKRLPSSKLFFRSWLENNPTNWIKVQ